MPGVAAIEADIHALTERRAAIWAGHRRAAVGEVQVIARKLADLYEARRQAQAQIRAGGRSHTDIVRQARVESELERLMTR